LLSVLTVFYTNLESGSNEGRHMLTVLFVQYLPWTRNSYYLVAYPSGRAD